MAPLVRLNLCLVPKELRSIDHAPGAPIMSDSEIQGIAAKHSVSAATILVSYHVNKGTVVLPKSVTKKRISSNKQVITMSKDDMAVLDGLAAKGKAQRINTPIWGFDLGFADWYGPVKVC